MSESTSNLKSAPGGVSSESTPDKTTEAEYFNPFGWIPPALLAWFAIFGLYEVVERTLLANANPDLEWGLKFSFFIDFIAMFPPSLTSSIKEKKSSSSCHPSAVKE